MQRSHTLLLPALLICIGCTGELDQSTNKNLAAGQDQGRGLDLSNLTNPNPSPDLGGVDPADQDTTLDLSAPQDMSNDMPTTTRPLSKGPWVRYLNPSYDTAFGYNPNSLPSQDALFEAPNTPSNGAITVARLRPLDQLEWIRNAGSMANYRDQEFRAVDNPFEVDRPHAYSTYRQGEALGEDKISQYFDVLPVVSQPWAAPRGARIYRIPEDRYIGNIRVQPQSRMLWPQHLKTNPAYLCMFETNGGQVPTRTCIKDFASLMLQKILLLRAPEGSEVNQLVDFIEKITPKIDPGTYSTDVAQNLVDTLLAQVYLPDRSPTAQLAPELANAPEVTCMSGQDGSPPEDACLTSFVSLYLERAVLFRPPTEGQIEDLTAFAKESRQALPTGRYDDEMRKRLITEITQAAWLGASAVFRPELGQGAPDPQGRLALGAWEVADVLTRAIHRRSPGAPAVSHAWRFKDSLFFDSHPAWSLPTDALGKGYDAALVDAAKDGSIKDRAKLATLIRQALGGIDPSRGDLPMEKRSGNYTPVRGEYWLSQGLQRFFREWLEVDQLASKFKDAPAATSKYQLGPVPDYTGAGYDYNALRSFGGYLRGQGLQSYEPLYLDQLDDMIARIVVEDQDVFETLMTSRRFFTSMVDRRTVGAQTREFYTRNYFVYNFETPHDGSRANRWRSMPSQERAGILTHPAWLGAHSDNFENGTAIIYRGKWIRERLLCGVVPPVRGDVPAQLVEGRGKSGRERVDQSTDAPACTGCHGLMNALGKPFEIYNHAGFVRAFDTKNGERSEPDGSSTLENMPPSNNLGPLNDGAPITDAIDFAQKLGQSTHARRCFTRQLFRAFMGRPETEEDAPTLSSMETSYLMNNGSLIEMLVTLMTSDAFLMRLPSDVLFESP